MVKDTNNYKYKNEVIICKCGCGIELLKYDNVGRERKFILGHHVRLRSSEERKRIGALISGNKNPAKRIWVREKLRKKALEQFKNGVPEETKKKLRKKALEQFKNGMPEETKQKIKKTINLSEVKLKISRRTKEMMKNPEIIQKIKEARAKQIFPVKNTSIEVKIQNFLKKLGIEYFTHQYIKIPHGYQCDILIPAMNLVIECDGNYWHKYPVGNDIDHVRTKELIQKGFKVLRLWEFEINAMSIKQFKEKLHEI